MSKKANYDPRSIKLGHKVIVEGVEYPSKSVAIKELSGKGMSKGEIAKVLQIRYQFVYNVLSK